LCAHRHPAGNKNEIKVKILKSEDYMNFTSLFYFIIWLLLVVVVVLVTAATAVVAAVV